MLRLVLCVSFIANALGLSGPTPRLDGRIVGGEAVEIQQYPHQLSLLYRGKHICGASVISPKYAITAAHCTNGASTSTLSIRAGSTFRNKDGTTTAIAVIHQNSNYSSSNVDYDISILELAQELEYDNTVQPISLPEFEEVIPADSPAVCTGWGTTKEGGSLSNQLQAVHLSIVENKRCSNVYGLDKITDRMICAGVPEGGKDACQGDSGGPLVVDGKLVGVVSWGIGCARKEYPGVYASVPNLRNFIKDVVGF